MAYIGKSIESGTFSVLDTSGNTYNGSNTTFSLGTQVGSPAQLLVSHDGVIQKPGTDYSLASGGTQITFSTAPASGASIFIVEISGAVGGPLASDLNGAELILDADGDTSITADTDDQIDVKIAGADDFKFTANTFTANSGSGIVIPDGGLTLGSTAISSTAAELNILDGVTATAAELNIVDGNTSATSTTLADADRVVVNDAGTMKQVAMTDVKTYMGGGGLVPISTIALSAAAQVNMASVFSDTYLNYFLVLSMIKVAADNSLDIQFGTGGSYDGGDHYGWTNHFMINNGTNGASVSDGVSNKIRLIPDIDADSEGGASGQFIITNPKGGYQRKHISGTAAVQKTTAGNTAIVNTAGTFHESTTQNFTDIRFLTGNGGNFVAGSTSGGYGMIQLFGIVNS